METFDLTPDPKILIALTHTPMQPLDAICELIDNSLDAFQSAELQGNPIKSPMVIIDLPKKTLVNQGEGYLTLRDNGLGLSQEMAEKALRAGYSGNNPYDSLGLFGMGFNISTGKLGRITSFLTARKHDELATEVIINLEEINKAKNYKVPVNLIKKPENFECGTLVRIYHWWPEGNPNNGFIRKLVQYSIPKIREEIGRRYSTILREKKIQIIINSESVIPFEHCVWSDVRYVERRGLGKVPAIYRFNEVVGIQSRCTSCTALIEQGKKSCQVCGSSSMRTIEERIRGWVGIQRFDDPTEFGIDIMRNGRAIRIGEKAAFFEFTDEFKHTIKDYPIDSPYGRIVGEVNINHVPVDFLKQDFQRSSPEWQRVMQYMRGDSSLQPSQPGADQNKSAIFKLYQGYRRVRNIGKGDMYMGYWDEASGGPKRISRDVEREYLDKFRQKQAGFYDDFEWWKLVEQADKKPLEELVVCPNCSAQNLQGYDVCQACGHILQGKQCVVCSKSIPATAVSCPECGSSQIPEIKEPWLCNVCKFENHADDTNCKGCGALKGSLHPLSRDYLLANSNKSDELSIDGTVITLADGRYSVPLNVRTYITSKPLVSPENKGNLPLIVFKSPDYMEAFIDFTHKIYKSYGIMPEQMIAAEAALFIYDSNRALASYQGIHSLSNIQWQIINSRWSSTLEDTPEKVRNDVIMFFANLRQQLPNLMQAMADDFYDEMSDVAKKKLVDNMLSNGQDITKLVEMKTSGEYLRYIGERTVLDIFRQYPHIFFDHKYWAVPYTQIPGLPVEVVDQIQQKNKFIYLNCLEDIVEYLTYQNPERNITTRARASLNLLLQKLV